MTNLRPPRIRRRISPLAALQDLGLDVADVAQMKHDLRAALARRNNDLIHSPPMTVILAILLLVTLELADARPEYRVILFAALFAFAFLRWVYRRPSARAEAKQREMRRAFRRSLVNRSNFQ